MKENKLRALIAEDNPINMKLISTYLQKLGVEIETAEDGLELLGKYVINPDKYDIIFMDIKMPVMDGIETAVEILEFEKERGIPHTPIIAVTTQLFKDKVIGSIIDDYILKPVNKEHFERIIKKNIG